MATQFNYGICTNRDKDGEGNPCPLCASKERQKLPANRDFVCRECKEPLQKVNAPIPFFKRYKYLIIGAAILVVVGVFAFLLMPFGGETAGKQEGTNGGTTSIETNVKENDTSGENVEKVNVESLAFSEGETEIRLAVGEEKNLDLICTPENADETIAYRSENISVATISAEGVVKAVGKGTTRITAVTDRTGISVTVPVVVVADVEPVGNKLNLGFATYEGDVRNGKAHGNGVMTFKTRHVIPGAKDDIEAQAGESVQGAWRNGEVNLVTLYQKNGNRVKIMHK